MRNGAKISGAMRGVVRAGTKILYTILTEALPRSREERPPVERLIVFTRYPEAGTSKTRMIPALGAEGAAELHRAMTSRTLLTVRKACAGRTGLEVCYAGGTEESMSSWLGPDLCYRPQIQGDLGTRMRKAFEGKFEEGCERVSIVGTDCPELGETIVRKAFAMLRTEDVVVGPTVDGGYYLIGLRRSVPELFEGVAWGTGTVFSTTIALAEDAGLAVGLLPMLRDVDTPDDLGVWQEIRDRESSSKPAVSVIIPTVNEADHIAATLAAIGLSREVEAIVADGGSTDATRTLAETYGARVVHASRGRAVQMNAGAQAARGEVLIFLHADTRLPQGYLGEIRRVLSCARTVAGAFRLGIDHPGFVYRLIEMAANFRAARRQLPYGDQALFMRRETFQQVGGYPEIPIMEDVELVRRLRALGLIRIAEAAVQTSSRRWEAAGPWRLGLIHQLILWGYRVGISPERLAAFRK